jgi:hypothetical protein
LAGVLRRSPADAHQVLIIQQRWSQCGISGRVTHMLVQASPSVGRRVDGVDYII